MPDVLVVVKTSMLVDVEELEDGPGAAVELMKELPGEVDCEFTCYWYDKPSDRYYTRMNLEGVKQDE